MHYLITKVIVRHEDIYIHLDDEVLGTLDWFDIAWGTAWAGAWVNIAYPFD